MKIQQNLNCGSCLFLNRDATFDKKCSELGKLLTSKACLAYKPDVFQLVGSTACGQDRLHLVSKALIGMSLPEIQALSAVLSNEKNTRKHGWKFYQRVYVRFIGSTNANYFTNSAVGFVVSADKEYVRVVGNSGKMMVTLLNDKSSSTLYTVDRFKALSVEMTAKKHFVDPSLNKVQTHRIAARQLDDVLDDRPLNKDVVPSKTRKDDLVSLIEKMSKDFSLKPKKPKRANVSTEISADWRR